MGGGKGKRFEKKVKKKKSTKNKQEWENDGMFHNETGRSKKRSSENMKHQWKRAKTSFRSRVDAQNSARQEKVEKYWNPNGGTINTGGIEKTTDDDESISSSASDDDMEMSASQSYRALVNAFELPKETAASVSSDDDDHDNTISDEDVFEDFDKNPPTTVKEEEFATEETEDEVYNSDGDKNDSDTATSDSFIQRSELLNQICKDGEDLEARFAELKKESSAPAISEHIRLVNHRLGEKQGENAIDSSLLKCLNSYQDVCYTSQDMHNRTQSQQAYLLHALNHLTKSRRNVTRNNEILRKNEEEHNVRDQGFVRPTILILTPLRSTALAIVESLEGLLPTNVTSQNLDRFKEEYGVAADDDDEKKLKRRPDDWHDLFDGNNDDCFKIGLSLSRKTLRLYTEFYKSDIIIASPLGLRMEVEGNSTTDYLASIEMLVCDQADVFLMQNWRHVLDVVTSLNVMPTASHDVDFSRVREYELAGNAKYGRQTILLGGYQCPQFKSFFSKHCRNILHGPPNTTCSTSSNSGTMSRTMLQVKQVFVRVDQSDSDITASANNRFEYFKQHVLTPLLTSNQKHTVIFIPSYFDYVRVRNYLRSIDASGITHCCEYTTVAEVSHSRTSFFHGRRRIMLLTERFHYFKRYVIRGMQHLIFYGLPTNANFYPEWVNTLDGGSSSTAVEGEKSTSVLALYSKYDRLTLGRIVGMKRASKMMNPEKQTFMFC